MFEWNDAKNATNIAKHGIGFERASQIFSHWVFTEVDERFDYGEVPPDQHRTSRRRSGVDGGPYRSIGPHQDHLRETGEPFRKETL